MSTILQTSTLAVKASTSLPVTDTPAFASTVTELVDRVDASLVTSIVLFVSREMLPSDKVRVGLVAATTAAHVTVTELVLAVTEFPVTGQIQALAETVTVPTEAVEPDIASSALPQVLSPQEILLEDHPWYATFAF